MYQSDHLTNRSQLVRHLINRSAWRRGLHLGALALVAAWLALPPQAEAICEEGCDTNGNTFLGEGALSSTTTGPKNTATGYSALFQNTEGSDNTVAGFYALHNNTTGSDNTAIGGGRYHATRLRTATRLQDLTPSGETRLATGTRPSAMMRSLGT